MELAELMQCCLIQGTLSSGWKTVRIYGRASTIRRIHYFQVPTMKFLMSYKAQVVGQLVAWKGPDDPSSGDFSCSSDPSNPDLQFFSWNKTQPYCCISIQSGTAVSGGTYIANTSSILYQTTINSGDKFYYMFTISDNSTFMRLMLDYTGKIKFLSWNNHSSS